MEMKKFNCMLETDILRNSSHNSFGCPEGCFLRVWVSKKTPRRPQLYFIVRPLYCIGIYMALYHSYKRTSKLVV